MKEIIFTQFNKEELKELIKTCIREELELFHAEQKAKPKEEIISIEDVQKIFKVSKVTIHSWKKEGIIPFYKLGRRVFFKRNEVMAILENKGNPKYKHFY